ncbi:MAG: heme exporter protein CcmB [Pseudomonadota bacterium]|jgi:heme exporter protein B
MMNNFLLIFRQTLRAEFADRERLLSPLLFALVILVMLAFTFGEPPAENRPAAFVAQVFLSLVLATQTALARAFDPEQQDRAFDLLRASPVDPAAIFMAKLLVVLLQGVSILVPATVVSALFCGLEVPGAALVKFSGLSLLTITGLGSLGVTLAAMTLKAHARTVLFPLLYFPLATPLLLAGTQGGIAIISPESVPVAGAMAGSWVVVSLAANTIFLTLGILLFGELVKSD